MTLGRVLLMMGVAGSLGAACNKSSDGSPSANPKKPPQEGAAAPAVLPPPAAGRTHECHDRKRNAHQCAVTSAVAPAEAKVGEAVLARVTAKPKPGYKVNKDYPILLVVSPPDGVEVVKIEQAGPDAARLDEKEVTFDVKFTSKAAGEKKFTAQFNFAVCTDEECDPLVDNMAWNVQVK
jgi:hypothetical protein